MQTGMLPSPARTAARRQESADEEYGRERCLRPTGHRWSGAGCPTRPGPITVSTTLYRPGSRKEWVVRPGIGATVGNRPVVVSDAVARCIRCGEREGHRFGRPGDVMSTPRTDVITGRRLGGRRRASSCGFGVGFGVGAGVGSVGPAAPERTWVGGRPGRRRVRRRSERRSRRRRWSEVGRRRLRRTAATSSPAQASPIR